MTEEKKEVYEIKKESVKQFLIVLGGSFVGCLLAILLAGQLVKPKFPPCHCPMRPLPAYAHMHKFPPKHHVKGDFKRMEMKKKAEIAKLKSQQLSKSEKPVEVKK